MNRQQLLIHMEYANAAIKYIIVMGAEVESWIAIKWPYMEFQSEYYHGAGWGQSTISQSSIKELFEWKIESFCPDTIVINYTCGFLIFALTMIC